MQGRRVEEGHGRVLGAQQQANFRTAQDDALAALLHQRFDDTGVLGP